jgi:hypothetical protein
MIFVEETREEGRRREKKMKLSANFCQIDRRSIHSLLMLLLVRLLLLIKRLRGLFKRFSSLAQRSTWRRCTRRIRSKAVKGSENEHPLRIEKKATSEFKMAAMSHQQCQTNK